MQKEMSHWIVMRPELPIVCAATPPSAGPGGCEAAVWAALSTLLSDVLLRDQWLAVWDHLVALPPQRLQAMAAALLMTARERLLAAQGPKRRLALLRKPMAIDARKVQCLPCPGDGTKFRMKARPIQFRVLIGLLLLQMISCAQGLPEMRRCGRPATV